MENSITTISREELEELKEAFSKIGMCRETSSLTAVDLLLSVFVGSLEAGKST